MLQSRIINTLKFFDLQHIPLTALEVHKYLLADTERVQRHLNEQWEVKGSLDSNQTDGVIVGGTVGVALATVLAVLMEQCSKTDSEIKTFRGYYFLKSRDDGFVLKRLENYLHAVKRERRIRRYGGFARYIPFVRGVGLVGSQALGQYRAESDIDILVFTAPGFLWTARVLITIYFQLLGVRRYGNKIATRFCLNHYVAGPKQLQRDRNIYTASEYLKMRPLYPSRTIERFKQNNLSWIRIFFPHATADTETRTPQSRLQRVLEKILKNKFGQFIERQLKRLLIGRITQDDFVVVEDDELSFHPHNRKADLFAAFFKS